MIFKTYNFLILTKEEKIYGRLLQESSKYMYHSNYPQEDNTDLQKESGRSNNKVI